MRNTRRLLLVAVALSLLVHLFIAVILRPAAPGLQNESEVVSIEHRPATIRLTKAPTPPPRPLPSPPPSPRAHASAPPKGRNPGRGTAGAGRPAVATAPPAAPVPTPRPSAAAANRCDRPNAGAAVASSPAPPEIAPATRAEGTSGVAVISVQLDPTGSVTGANVQQSTGNSSLDLVAVGMARDARYSPALHDCKPIAATYSYSVKFVAW
ncbi:MAG: TonB family protein [Candidatus Eremiobacteraeota bacterium]|nr:TonB family protein [Candidatus Eremiobacteraeota bacterium]